MDFNNLVRPRQPNIFSESKSFFIQYQNALVVSIAFRHVFKFAVKRVVFININMFFDCSRCSFSTLGNKLSFKILANNINCNIGAFAIDFTEIRSKKMSRTFGF